MTGWARKRFWSSVSVDERPEGFSVLLDGRGLRTPAKAPLVVPTRALAEMVAAEWAAQRDTIDPESMPATRAANAAIDKVRGQFHEVAALLTAYGETDLLCYRAESPAELVLAQSEAWDPLLDWSVRRFGVLWEVTSGVMPAPQPSGTVHRLAAHVVTFSPFQLTAFHDLVALSGSLVIGLAATEAVAQPHELWQASRIDEDWQASQWGADEEAATMAAARRRGFLVAAELFSAASPIRGETA